MARAARSLILALFAVALPLVGLARFDVSTARGASAWLTGWANGTQLTVNHAKVGGTLSKFPVLIHVSSSSGITAADVSSVFSSIGANSGKIAVTGADGVSQQYVEIERWDSANRQAYLWTKIPSVSNIADTVLYLYYDNSKPDNTAYVGATGSAAAQNVWDSTFVAVWHMAQSGGGSAGDFRIRRAISTTAKVVGVWVLALRP